MEIHSLKNVSTEEIATCFNKAFEDYFVPIKMDIQQLSDKMKSENIQPELSVGVSLNNVLVGFILIGIDPEKKIAYNAGTGVIPEFRGQKLTEQMYAYILPELENRGFQNLLLEVICSNTKAKTIYENLGYTVLRKVICYKGKITNPKKSNYSIEVIELPVESDLKPFWNHNPTYQNSLFSIKNNYEKHTVLGAFDNEKLAGYIVFDKNSLRIKQFAVDKESRKKGLGHQLFYQVQLQKPEAAIVLINIDESDIETTTFIREIGFNSFISQYEMKLVSN